MQDRKKRKYTYNPSNYKGKLLKALVSTQIRENPFFNKYLIDTLVDARKKWMEMERTRLFKNPKSKPNICPIPTNTIVWMSQYFAIQHKNGDNFIDKYINNNI